CCCLVRGRQGGPDERVRLHTAAAGVRRRGGDRGQPPPGQPDRLAVPGRGRRAGGVQRHRRRPRLRPGHRAGRVGAAEHERPAGRVGRLVPGQLLPGPGNYRRRPDRHRQAGGREPRGRPRGREPRGRAGPWPAGGEIRSSPAFPVTASWARRREGAGMATRTAALVRMNRWVILAGYALLTACTQLLWLAYAPITTQTHQAMGVSSGAVGDLAIIFPLTYVIL